MVNRSRLSDDRAFLYRLQVPTTHHSDRASTVRTRRPELFRRRRGVGPALALGVPALLPRTSCGRRIPKTPWWDQDSTCGSATGRLTCEPRATLNPKVLTRRRPRSEGCRKAIDRALGRSPRDPRVPGLKLRVDSHLPPGSHFARSPVQSSPRKSPKTLGQLLLARCPAKHGLRNNWHTIKNRHKNNYQLSSWTTGTGRGVLAAAPFYNLFRVLGGSQSTGAGVWS